MRRATLAPALVAAALLAGCGETNTALIPEDRAQALLTAVDQVEAACSGGDAQDAQARLDDLSAQANELPRRVDEQLKRNIQDWIRQLERRLDRDCEPEPTETVTPEPTETVTPEPTETPDTGGATGPDEEEQQP